MKKKDLIEKWESAIESAEFYGKGKEEDLVGYMKEFIADLNQLDEPEVLSQEWIDEHEKRERLMSPFGNVYLQHVVPSRYLQNLLVPKQEEVDRAYKEGYEKGKEHATRDDEPETVASVMADFFRAAARIKEALAREVEEMEENDNN